MSEERKQQKQEARLPDLFVGPLGKAQIDALKFTAKMSTVDTQIALLEKIDAISKMLEGRDEMSEIEITMAEKLYDELTDCFLALHEENTYDTNAKTALH